MFNLLTNLEDYLSNFAGYAMINMDPKLRSYCKMYGARVVHRFRKIKGKIVKRPENHSAHKFAVFIKYDESEEVASFDPSYFIYIFDINETSSLGSSIRSFLEPVYETEETLKRILAIEKIKSSNKALKDIEVPE